MDLFRKKLQLSGAMDALPGRDQKIQIPKTHFVNGNPMTPPFADNLQTAIFGLGCFWGAEKCFWEKEGVYVTAVGYAGGSTPNPGYEEVCSGLTGHNEVVLVVFDPEKVTYDGLLALFWENHDPTQGMRQGNDIGTQYRSGIYTFSSAQESAALASKGNYQQRLLTSGYSEITTEIVSAAEFYYAEHYHQQYLAKVPNGYCALGGTGVCFSQGQTNQ